MNYSKAFSYVFEDNNWFSKIAIAGLISLIPIIGQIYLLGWMIEIVRRVKAGRTDILPTTHFAYFLTLGLKLFVVSLIYSIPVIILSFILNIITGSAGNSDSSAVSVFLAGLGCFGGLISFIVGIAVSLFGTYGTIKLAETDQIKACLDFSDGYNCIKSNLSTFIIVELLSIVANLIGSAGVIICVIGVLLTMPYGIAITGHLVGQLWNNLKPYSNSNKPYKGSTSADDIIAEAPFTKVQDIEKNIQDEETAAQEEIVVAHETIIYQDDNNTSDEPVIDTNEAENQPAAENSSEEESNAEVKQTEEKSEEDNDLPSFE